MSLQDQLDQEWVRMQKRSPRICEAYEALVTELDANRITDSARKAGDLMPDFELPSADGRLVAAGELLEHGPLALSFFRGGWCPYCTLELKALQAALPEISRRRATLLAITPDTGAWFTAAKRDNALAYEVLSDADYGVGLTFGVVFRVPERIKQLYLDIGIDLGARHGNRSGTWVLPLPATYVVDRQGIIVHAEVEPDFKRRMEPAEIIRKLAELSDNVPAG